MKLDDLLNTAKDSVVARRVFADPYEKDGVSVIAAARISGGGGGGNGNDNTGQHGEGGGLGLTARPSGAYVIKDGAVRWVPAVDVNRLITTAGVITVTALLTAARRTRRRDRRGHQDPPGVRGRRGRRGRR